MVKVSKTPTRKELLSLTDSELENRKLEHQLKADELKLMNDINETDLALHNAREQALNFRRSSKFSPADIIAADREVVAYEEGLNKLNLLKEELFPIE